MPYRTTKEEGLAELSPSALSTCGLLAWEMLRRDRRATVEEIDDLFAETGVGESFEQRLGAAVRSFDVLTADEDRQRWNEMVTNHIEKLTDPLEREIVFSFLFNLATIATINPAEAALLDRLRSDWDIVVH